jgi:signal transduction histidine kinase
LNKKFSPSKLEIKLILCLILSFIISVSLFFLLEYISSSLLDDYFNKNSFISSQESKALSDFKAYVSENNLSIKDKEKIDQWASKEKYVDIYIYHNNKLVYIFNENNADAYYLENPNNPFLSDSLLHDIKFSDIDTKLYMNCYFQYKYYNIVSLFDLSISFLCFISIMLFFIRRKTNYIETLENELKILEGGNLDYEITIKGKDELSSLAHSLNEMRKSFIEKLESENKTRLANSELITAISHDLRTPLTAIVGYLDIIEYKKYKSEENLKQYIHNSREKAYQIKYLSDKLFEYFIAFSTDDESLEFESFDGNELLDQLLGEHLIVLNDKGFTVLMTPCDTKFFISINLISMRRVFDNIFSNISKYADPSQQVKVSYYIKDQLLFITFENRINKNLKEVSSTEIGLKTCEKIIEKHSGTLLISKAEEVFSVQIRLNVYLT